MRTYGKIIPDLIIDGVPAPYGVVNEREIRATAGIMLVLGLSAFYSVVYDKNVEFAFWVVLAFWIDFVLKVVIDQEWSYIGRISAWIVRRQKPEYVGAIQKRFAWSIGLILSSIVLVLIARINFFSGATCSATVLSPCFVPMILCGICLFFMWLESAGGICVGCQIYSWLLKKGWIQEPIYRPACPGGVCSLEKH